jgi:serine/threonine protein kinase
MKYSKKLKSKLTNKSKRKYNKSIIKGGSKIYDNGNITDTKETYNGESFFRKMFYYSDPTTEKQNHLVHVEKSIVSILMENPHPNIVKFFKITNRFVDMEELNTKDVNIDEAIKVMKGVKDFLQRLGIAYIDWKIDNIGKDKDGIYKLFDFDVSGIFDKDKNNWLVKPVEFFNYNKAIKNGYTTPKDIDNFLFLNFVKKE